MSIKVRIEDGDGSGNRAKVTEGGYVYGRWQRFTNYI
jgi:hypothetical protein